MKLSILASVGSLPQPNAHKHRHLTVATCNELQRAGYQTSHELRVLSDEETAQAKTGPYSQKRPSHCFTVRCRIYSSNDNAFWFLDFHKQIALQRAFQRLRRDRVAQISLHHCRGRRYRNLHSVLEFVCKSFISLDYKRRLLSTQQLCRRSSLGVPAYCELS